VTNPPPQSKEEAILIEVKNLTKRYGQHVAVDDISFTVNEGEIVGFLGPNGAGKTTTMNILTGFISATKGEVRIGGADILDEPETAKKKIGYMPDNPPLYGEMLVDEFLSFVCDIKGVKNKRAMIDEVKERVKITHMGKRLVRNLSKGYKQRVGLAQALIGYPAVLILDEPTVGLDPKQIIEMRSVIKELGKGHTLILSSHILPEVSAVCDRVIIINRGKIMAHDSSTSLSASLNQGQSFAVRFKGERGKIKDLLSDIGLFRSVSPISSYEPGTFDFEIKGSPGIDIREAIFGFAAANSLPILQMKPQELTLEDIFLRVTGADFAGMDEEAV
jgi:ABC-2 type transport system ATP-binding protein